MKILFEVKNVSKPNSLPKLKTGVELIDLGGGKTFVGNLKHGIQIENIPISLLRLFNGRRTYKQISELTLVQEPELDELIELLSNQGLLDLYPTKLIFEDRYNTKVTEKDIAMRDFNMKLNSELTTSLWRNKVNDGGKVLISKRQDFAIKLEGDEEFRINLYLQLLASGFNSIEIDIPRDVQLDDLRTGQLHLSDAGKPTNSVLDGLAKYRKLFNSDSTKKDPDLLIYFGRPTEKEIQKWLSLGISHLSIESIGPNIVVGPLVIPGQTPCLNCVAKVDTKILRNIKEISAFQKPAIGALNWITGYLNLIIAEFVDTGNSPLIGSAKVFDVVNPNEIRDIKYPRHPACGCNW